MEELRNVGSYDDDDDNNNLQGKVLLQISSFRQLV
jgi:hypothetical protein